MRSCTGTDVNCNKAARTTCKRRPGAHERTLAELRTARDQAAVERDAADGEFTRAFVTAGTILNRVERRKLAPRRRAQGRRQRARRPSSPSNPRAAPTTTGPEKGLLTVGIAAGVAISSSSS
jgi:hypothetical protein